MRILVVGLNFHPEPTGIGKYTGELAAYLASRGHEVRAVTTPPYYPYWRVQPGYRWWEYRRETWREMTVFRAPLWVPSTPSGLTRLLHLLSFAIFSFPLLLLQVPWRPHIILCMAPAFFSAPFSWLVGRLCGAKTWLHVQDLELDAARDLGILPSSNILAKLASWGESAVLKRFDYVSTISDSMRKRLEKKGVQADRSWLFPNWVDTDCIFPLPGSKNPLREELGVADGSVVILYSGTMGLKQGLECLVAAARELQEETDLLFLLCGEGSARSALEQLAGGLPNIRFLPLQPPEKLNQLLNAADIHVLPQKRGAADSVMPSKLPGMLATGRPVIAMADPGTEMGCLVRGIGILVPPEDVAGLCRAILSLADSPSERRRLGGQGRAYVCRTWKADLVLNGFEQRLQDVVNGERQLQPL